MDKFPLGHTVITAGAARILTHESIQELLQRHASGDWGSMPPEDAEQNEQALIQSDRLMSEYMVRGQKFWVITEADRSLTTVLLPEEY